MFLNVLPADGCDSFSIDFEYPCDRFVSFKSRHLPGTASDVGDTIHGSRGTCHIGAANAGSRIVDRAGKVMWEMKGSLADARRQEHEDLIDSIRAGKPIVELRQMAASSLVGVMGRLAAYTGQNVTWKCVSEESRLDLFSQKPHAAVGAANPRRRRSRQNQARLTNQSGPTTFRRNPKKIDQDAIASHATGPAEGYPGTQQAVRGIADDHGQHTFLPWSLSHVRFTEG